MYIHDFFQNFLKTFLVCFHGAFTSSVIAPDIPPLAGAYWLVLIWFERKTLLSGCSEQSEWHDGVC